MIGLSLFLPESWTGAPDRMAKARVPETWRAARTKPEIALAEIDRIRASGVRFATVLADAGYGLSAPFRQGLDGRGLKWAVGIPKQQKVYPSNVRLVFPIAGRGRPRKRHIPDQLSERAEDVLATAKWRRVSWRKGTKGPLAASFAAVRVRIADGPPQRIHDKGMQHMPGEEAWLVGERRASGERKYYLSNLPPDASLKTLAAAIKARWVCEQAHQQLKEELGLDHFEGRSWHGLHRHTLMTMIAYAYLQSRRLAAASGGKKNPPRAAQADAARDPARRARHSRSRAAISMSPLQANPPKTPRINLPK
jgi:SRSO17 transposase